MIRTAPLGKSVFVQLALILLLAAAYVGAARVSHLFSGHPVHGLATHASIVWFPAGIALAALLLGGMRLAPGVALGAFAAAYSPGGPVLLALVSALGATASAATAAWWLKRQLGFSLQLDQSRHLGSLVGIGAFVAPTLAATINMAAAYLIHLVPGPEGLVLWVMRWETNALGVLLIAPVVLTWLRADPDRRTSPRMVAALLSLQLGVGVVVALRTGSSAGALVYLTLALVVAMYLPLRWVALGNLLTFIAAATGTLFGTGPFADAASGGLASLQTYGIVSSLAVLLVYALARDRENAAVELRAGLERFRQLTALSSDFHWEQDENLRFTRVDGRAVDDRHIDAHEWIGRTRSELAAGEVPDAARASHDHAVQARLPFRDLLMTRSADDSEPRIVDVSGAPVFGQDQRFLGYRGVARDVTQQKRAEREIEEAKSFLDALINAIPTPVLVKDEQHRFVAVNAAFSVFFRRAPESIIGKTDFHFFSAEDADFYQKTDDQAFQGVAIEYERPYVVSGQPPRWMRVRKSVLTRPNGSRLVVLLMIDITEQHAALAQLSASEQRFRSLTQLSADWFWEQDAQLNFTFVSAQTANHDAMRLTDVIGATQLKPDLEWESEHACTAYRTCIEARRSFKDVQLRDPITGRSISLNGEAVFDSEGKFQGYRGTATDITERRVSQQRIARLKDMYAAMSEANSVIIHSRNPSELFEAICRIAIESVHFMFVRIALLDARSGSVHTVAEQGHLLQGGVGTSAEVDAAVEQRMAEHSVRTGMNFVYNDISIEPRLRSWRTQLADQGVRSLATLLLRGNGRVVGTLHLYSGQFGFFDEELVGLLEKLTMNLSFALDNFQRDDARQAAQRALVESETRFRDFADAAGEYVWETDLDGKFTYVSSRVLSVWGYSDQELIGRASEEMMPANEAARVAEWMKGHLAHDGSFRDLEHKIVNRQGEIRWLLINAVCMFDANGKHVGRRGTGRDITERKNSEARINYLATRDPLTELPNRLLFNDRLEQGILAAQRTGQSLAVLFIDLDRFKTINDSLGHQVGDLLLKEVAVRMQASIRKGDTVSRLGGDEFVVTLEGLQHADDAAQVAAKIIKSLSRSVEISGHTLNTSCSIGISIFPLDAKDDRTLMKNADTAMYHAKEKGRNNYQFFSTEMNVRAVERHNLETQLRQAVERQEFILHYQPQVDMRTGKVVGTEALLRWKHPERGLLGPSTFIHVAEETGLIEPIGQWALQTACQCARDWQAAGYPALRMAVNISSRQLMRPKDFARMIAQTLSSTGLDPRLLELEMTESLLVHNADDNIAFLRKLGQDGIRIAVDDFGTGYSSLSYLRQLPIDTLKIDRSFVRNIDVDSEDLAIIQAIVAMAHSLDLQVTAEGVDARGQLAALAGLGCDQYQGYLYSRPLPDVELAARFLAPRELDFEPVPLTAKPRSADTHPLI